MLRPTSSEAVLAFSASKRRIVKARRLRSFLCHFISNEAALVLQVEENSPPLRSMVDQAR